MIFFNNISLQKQVFRASLLFISMLVLVAACAFGYIFQLQRNAVTAELRHEAALIEQMLTNRLRVDQGIASDYARRNPLKILLHMQLWSQLEKTLNGFAAPKRVQGAWILGPDEKVRVASTVPETIPCPMGLSGPSETFQVTESRLHYLVRRTIYDREHNLLGFLILSFTYPEQSFLDQLGNAQSQFIIITHDNKMVAASTALNRNDLASNLSFTDSKLRIRINQETEPDIFLAESIGLTINTWQFTMYLLRDLDPIQRPLRMLALALSLFSCLVVCGSLIFYIYLRRNIIQPVIRLSDVAREIRTTGSISPVRDVDYPSQTRNEIWYLISSFKAMVGYLNTARKEAETASSMKDTFLATVSHEIRTPLHGIFGMTQLLQRSGLTSKQRQYVSNMIISIQNLQGIINDVLDISKIKAHGLTISPQEVHLPALLQNVHLAHDSVARAKDVEMRLEMDTNLPQYVRTDPLRLQQVLNNLINNALKFTDQGHVTLEARCRETQQDQPKIAVTFTVSDTGIGIPENQQATIFAPFSQVDDGLARTYPGTGLGLSIASEIVSLLGGTGIDLQSTPDKGSRFSLTLELETIKRVPQDAQTPSGSSPHNTPDASFRHLSILVAEDNAMNQDLIREIFELMDIHQFSICADGPCVLDKLKKHPDDYHALLLDIQMPGMDGFMVASKIRKTGNTIPIVAMTGLVCDKDREHSKECGIDHYLTKPFKICELKDIFRKLRS